MRNGGIFCFLSLTGICLAQSNQNKLIYVFPQAINARPQQTVTAREVDPFRGADDFGAVVSTNNSFGAINVSIARPFFIGVATQLSTIPIASPASGVIFREDKATGVSLPSNQSLGPILTERAETIGKGRFYLGFTRQQFRFEKLEGQNIGNMRALDKGGVPTLILQDGVRQLTSPTTVGTQIDARIDQNVALMTYGVTNRLDVSVGMSWVNSSLGVAAFDAQIHNTGDPFNQGTCWCAQTYDVNASRNTFGQDFGRSGFRLPGIFGSVRRTSSGIGDTVIRAKATVLERQNAALAIGADLRLPTGDELNLHGQGAVSFKPYAALSLHSKKIGAVRFSPHFNVGYMASGKSYLAGDPLSNTKAALPHQFSWSAGAATSITDRFTVVTDIMGVTLLDANRLIVESVSSRGQNIAPISGVTLGPDKRSLSMTNGAFGLKIKIIGNFVFNTNVLVAFDSNGLRDKFVPLFGIGHSF